jgi:hypothetical protein
MSIDVLENPVTNIPQMGPKGGGSSNSRLADILQDLGSAGGAAIEGVKGLGKYAFNTIAGDRNSVPYSVRLAVGGARKAEDKLRTLRQFYPDAMPTMDGDFTFIDPKTKQRVSFNDPGLSVGDVFENAPQVGEVGGAILGSLGGAAIGSLGGPVGTVAGGIGGAGAGAALGQESTRQAAQDLASLLTGKNEIDTRTPGEIGKEALITGGLNSAFTALPYGAVAGKNWLAKKLLTDESPAMAKWLLGKGYEPTLGQVGSPTGKEMSDNMVAGGIMKNELANQDILKGHTNDFLGSEASGLDQNTLANRFHASQKETIQGKKEFANKLYDNVEFGNSPIPADSSRSVIQDIYSKRGIAQGETANPDFVFDASMERKMKRVMEGTASEAELNSFRSDIKTMLRRGDLKYDTKGALIDLDKALTDDLVKGSPELTEADRTARKAYFDYKDSQNTVKNILGRAEGVTDKTAIGQGLTEGQALKNARNVFLNSERGSDLEAEALSKVLNPEDKKTILASILQEDQSARGFENSIEKAQQNYNMDRFAKYLMQPEERQSFYDLVKEAQGTKSIPPGIRDRSDLINAEAMATAGATMIDPTLGAASMAIGNILRKAPGTAGGSGQFATSMIRQNPFMQKGRQIASNIALDVAKKGYGPSNLNYMPESALTIPATSIGGQAVFGNLGDTAESNLRIPESVVDEALPKTPQAAPQNAAPKGSILDEILQDTPKASSSILDELMSDNKPAQPPAQKEGAMTLDEYMSKNYGKQAGGVDDDISQKSDLPAKVRQRESSNNYNAINTKGNVGAYQMGAQALEDVGYLKPGASKMGNQALNDPNNWNIEGGLNSFLSNKQLQDQAMLQLLEDNKARLIKAGYIDENTPQNKVNGYLAVMHLAGMGGVEKLMKGKVARDPYGTSTSDYYNLGVGA